MKYIFRGILLIAMLCTFNLKAQDFYQKYKELDSLPNISKLVLNNIEKAQWDGATLHYQTRDSKGLKYFSFNVQTKETKENESPFIPAKIERKKGQENKKYISPDNKYEAFIEDSNVWLKDIASGTINKLSYNGTDNHFYESLYWSADSKKIAAIMKKDSPMRKIPLIESAPKNQKQPKLHWRNYYKPGDLIPVYTPALFDVINKKQIEIETKPFEDQYFLSFKRWKNNSEAFTFTYNKRGHQVYQVVDVCAESGKTNVIVDEKSETFIHYNRIYLSYFDNDSSLLWTSERDGWNHLYLIDARSGEVKKQLTKGEWVVRNIIDVNEANGYILLSGNGKNKGEDPYNIHYYKVYYKGTDAGKIIDLTPEKRNHIALFDKDKKYFLDTYSAPDKAPISVIRSTEKDGLVHDFGQADISNLIDSKWSTPEVFCAKGRDGKTDIWGNIYRPSNFDPKKKYPVIEYIYAGPHDAFVEKNFKVYDRFNKLADMGFIIVSIDGMGTANRSKAFHDVCWRDLKDSGFPDRILWIKEAAKKYKYIDISNGVGVYGYSAGGQSTMSALLFFNDFYTVGVSLCGCHDNRMDKIWWNEQWMGYPLGEWYSQSSNVDNAHLLKGKLLLINGELDDNVDPTSTLQVVDALVKANKHFEQLYLPGYGHNLGDNYVTGRIFEFFWRNLKPTPLK